LAYRALESGGGYPVVLNAANEVAVAAFLEGALGFTSIPVLIERTLDAYTGIPAHSLEEVRALDNWSRQQAQKLVADAGRRLKLGV
jgi:1-deoxy-D-xylulose-5-phosphate reductoisomerase